MSGEELINGNYTTAESEKSYKMDEEETISAKEQRARELAESFSYDGYQIVRKELFAHLRDPAMMIRHDSITFNTACIDGLEDVVYVHVMFNQKLKRIVVEDCNANDKDALRWCINKPDKRKPRKMTCRPFAELIYKEMGWNKKYRYKMLGYLLEYHGRKLYIFDLHVPEIFPAASQDFKSINQEYVLQNTDKKEEPVNTRKGFYPDDIAGSFGVSVEEHRKEIEVIETDGYVSMAMLTGKRPGQECKPETVEESSAPVRPNPDFG